MLKTSVTLLCPFTVVFVSSAVQLVNLAVFNKLGTDVMALQVIPDFVVFDPLSLIDG